jgi:hypothetical protein
MPSIAPVNSAPWWKHGHVWMVLSGPAVVVVASFFTFYLAYTGMDTVVDEDYYHKGVELSQTQGAPAPGLVPAMQARNHAATGVVVKPKP